MQVLVKVWVSRQMGFKLAFCPPMIIVRSMRLSLHKLLFLPDVEPRVPDPYIWRIWVPIPVLLLFQPVDYLLQVPPEGVKIVIDDELHLSLWRLLAHLEILQPLVAQPESIRHPSPVEFRKVPLMLLLKRLFLHFADFLRQLLT
jgi:hypothetical protein